MQPASDSPNADEKSVAKSYVSDLKACPDCGHEWAYEVGGKIYSRVIAIYSRERDMTVAWRCPACGMEWPRGTQIDG